MLAVAGPDLTFYYIDASKPGRFHDSRVLRESLLWDSMESGAQPFPEAVLIADLGYSLRDWLITPFTGNKMISAP